MTLRKHRLFPVSHQVNVDVKSIKQQDSLVPYNHQAIHRATVLFRPAYGALV